MRISTICAALATFLLPTASTSPLPQPNSIARRQDDGNDNLNDNLNDLGNDVANDLGNDIGNDLANGNGDIDPDTDININNPTINIG